MALALLPMAKVADPIFWCKFILKVIGEIKDRVQKMGINRSQENRIIDKLQKIEALITDMKLLDEDDLPPALTQAFQDIFEQMNKCKEYCQPSGARNTVKNVAIELVTVNERLHKANELEKGLDKVLKISLIKIQTLLLADQRRENRFNFQKIRDRVDDIAIAGRVPVLHSVFSEKSSGPVTKLRAENLKSHNHVKLTWEYDDITNDSNTNVVFQVQIFDDDKQLCVSCCETRCVVLGDPLLTPGKRYTFNVRATVEGMIPGPWSTNATVYYVTAIPAKPSMPRVSVIGTKKMKVIVRLPFGDEYDGDSVTHCLVELLPLNNDHNRSWTDHSFSTKSATHGELEIELDDLEDYCTYKVRVRFRNGRGDSPPSDNVEAKTYEPIPGTPSSFRFSSYRTAHMIKLRWKEPDLNHRFVNHYEIEYRTRWDTHFAKAGNTTRLSYRIVGLSQDTKYYCRIRAVNTSGQCGNYTDMIDETTRFNAAAKVALSPFVLLGGIFGAPILTGPAVGLATGQAVYDGNSDADEGERKAGALVTGVSAGVGAGVLGAVLSPLLAPATGAAMVYMFATHGDEFSDQSDLDEDEKKEQEKKRKKE